MSGPWMEASFSSSCCLLITWQTNNLIKCSGTYFTCMNTSFRNSSTGYFMCSVHISVGILLAKYSARNRSVIQEKIWKYFCCQLMYFQNILVLPWQGQEKRGEAGDVWQEAGPGCGAAACGPRPQRAVLPWGTQPQGGQRRIERGPRQQQVAQR